MKIIKYISIVMVLIIGVTQCKLPDNIDPKNPTEVPIETLFTNAEVALINQVDITNVNINTHNLTVQYWQEMQYFDESRYLYQDRKIPDGYVREFYRDALMDFKRVKELLADWGGAELERDNKIAIATILEVYAWQCIVDGFGDMPYTEALQLADNSRPAYDDAAGIYTAIMGDLGIALSMLKPGASYGGADVMFGGDIASWKAFGASLQLRLGMRLADVNNSAAQAAAESAVGTGVFAAGQGAILHYNGIFPHVNAIYDAYEVDGRKDFTPANTIVDLMNGLNDPRCRTFYSPLAFKYDVDPDTKKRIDTELLPQIEGEAQTVVLIYKGGDSLVQVDLPFMALQVDTLNAFSYNKGSIAGLDGAQTYTNYTHFADVFFEPTFPAILQDYAEVEFLLAEAVERGYGVGGTAEEHYNNAITASILYYGGTQAEVDTYLAREDVAYGTAADTWKEKIGTQKYIALYNRGVEAWAEWRRLDFPVLNIPQEMVYSDIPKRYPYPYDEKLQNEDNYNAAKALLPGGVDDHRSPVFWDVN